MGAVGSDAAIEAADIVLMNDNPMNIVEGMMIARKDVKHSETEHRIRHRHQNS